VALFLNCTAKLMVVTGPCGVVIVRWLYCVPPTTHAGTVEVAEQLAPSCPTGPSA